MGTDKGNRPGKWSVPIADLTAQIAPLRDEIRAAIEQVMDTAGFSNGPTVQQFEKDFAAYCGAQECVAVNSGTNALHVAMRCLGVGPGDEVITVSMSFIATAWPVLYLGARAVFVDIDRGRYTMDPGQLEAAITPKTKAIVPVHLYGQCADMDPILEIAGARGIPVVEDVAHAPGAEYRGRRAGAMGTIGCFSFYPTKNLGACGEGGAITTDDPEIAERARRVRSHGQTQSYVHDCVGYNYRMDGLQGAILGIKLKHLDAWNQARGAHAALYDRLLSESGLTLPEPTADGIHVYHLYVIRDANRDALQATLKQRGIEASLHYPVPIHLQKPFQSMGYGRGDLPVSEEVARTCLSLPVCPELTEDQIRQVVDALHAARG